MSIITNSVNECYLLNLKVNNFLRMDILDDQYMFIILGAEIEDCEISLVEGILLYNIKRIANLVKL